MTSEPIKYYSIYPRWEVDWKSVDWRKVAQDEGLIKRDEDCCTCADQPYGKSQWCAFCIRTGKDKELARKVAEMNSRAFAAHSIPMSSGIPSTARAILNIVPERKVEQKPADPRAEGRAIAGMNSHEPRLGSSKWSPE